MILVILILSCLSAIKGGFEWNRDRVKAMLWGVVATLLAAVAWSIATG